MALTDIIISRTSLFIFAFMLLLIAVNAIIMYVIRKRMNQKVKESPEYRKAFKAFDKQKVIKDVVTSDKKVKEEKKDPEGFNLSSMNPKLSYAYLRDWYLEKYHGGKIVLINMELTNGFHRLMKVKEKDEGFLFRGKKYIFDDDSKYYNMDAKLYVFDYHEQIALPFKRKIPVTAIKQNIESTDGIDVEYAMNPSTLQRFMTAKIAEGVMKGTQLDEFMKKLQTILIVTMVASLAHFALFLYASGILQNINIGSII